MNFKDPIRQTWQRHLRVKSNSTPGFIQEGQHKFTAIFQGLDKIESGFCTKEDKIPQKAKVFRIHSQDTGSGD